MNYYLIFKCIFIIYIEFLKGSKYFFSKLAYAVHKGVVKEDYEIHNWVPAGTQQYFTRDINERFIKNLPGKEKYFEFVGRKAPDKIRELYKGKIIHKIRSYGNSFIKI